MEVVFFIPFDKYSKAKQILEENPYDEQSFSRVGYKIREASSIGIDEKGYFLYIKANEEFIKKAKEKLKDCIGQCKDESIKKAKEEIEKEEENAIAGFGSIFQE
jgi:GH15 family glucan-1,4-alpha-glucosidase